VPNSLGGLIAMMKLQLLSWHLPGGTDVARDCLLAVSVLQHLHDPTPALNRNRKDNADIV